MSFLRSLLSPSKICFTCEERRARSDFPPDSRKADGLHATCRDCSNAKRRAANALKQQRDARRRQKAVAVPRKQPVAASKATQWTRRTWQKNVVPEPIVEPVVAVKPQKVAIVSEQDDIQTLTDQLAEKYPVFQTFTRQPQKNTWRLQIFAGPKPLSFQASDFPSLLKQALEA